MTKEKKKKGGVFSKLVEKLDRKLVKESSKACCSCCTEEEKKEGSKGCCQ